jgi:membrane-associated PAP2 superfamily phosphatase
MERKISKTAYHINRKQQIVFSFCLLIAALLLCEPTGLDMLAQHSFFHDGKWLIDRNNAMLHFLLYEGPKKAITIYGVGLLLLLLLSSFIKPLARFKTRRNLFIVLCLATVPASIGLGKQVTDVFCPYQLEAFGGKYPYSNLFQSNQSDVKGKCFPAGHASGGFALLLFVLIAKNRRNQRLALAGALSVGWAMGGYQMLNGRHFLSHTLTTLLLSWIIILTIHLLLYHTEKNGRHHVL